MLFGEETTGRDLTGGSTDDGYFSLSARNDFSTRHMGGSNLVFLDSHAKWYRAEKIINDGYQIGGVGPALPGAANGSAGGCPVGAQ